MAKKYLGKHLLLELEGGPPSILSDPDLLEQVMNAAALEMGATIVQSTFHHFSPLGVSGVVVIQESHLTIHTWPEYGYAAVDIFSCGTIDMESGVDFLIEKLEAERFEQRVFKRGRLPDG